MSTLKKPPTDEFSYDLDHFAVRKNGSWIFRLRVEPDTWVCGSQEIGDFHLYNSNSVPKEFLMGLLEHVMDEYDQTGITRITFQCDSKSVLKSQKVLYDVCCEYGFKPLYKFKNPKTHVHLLTLICDQNDCLEILGETA